MEQTPQPFGARLQTLLNGIEPPRSQAWLAEESGVPASTVSRLLRGERQPTPVVIESIAPVFGLEPALLVKDTDAEVRFLASGEWIKRSTYEAAVKKLAEYEARLNQLDGDFKIANEGHARESARRKDLESQLGQTHLQLQWAQRDIEDARSQSASLNADLRRYQRGLASAVAEVASLRAQLNVLAEELAATKKSSRASAILAGVAAVTGVVTAAHFMSGDDDPGGGNSERPAPATRRRRSE